MKSHHLYKLKPYIFKLLLATLIILVITTAGYAQKVTFKVNLQPQLEDSIFVPGRDQLYIQGDVFPLSKINKVYMKDLAPVDSIYEASVNFSSTGIGKRLAYNFFIDTPEKLIKEQTPRYIQLRRENRELDALYFNSFAW